MTEQIGDHMEAQVARANNRQTLVTLLEKARRDAVYEVETYLEENEIVLCRTYMKGDERLIGDRVDTSVIRQVLEEK